MDSTKIKKEPQESHAFSANPPNNKPPQNSCDKNENNSDSGDDEEEEEGEDIYEVERVVGHKRIEGSGLYYCLKWKGYSNDENTWEHETSVFCDVYVNEYWRRYEKAGGSRDDALGEDPEFRRMKRLAKAKQSSKRNQDALLPDLSPLLEQSSTNVAASGPQIKVEDPTENMEITPTKAASKGKSSDRTISGDAGPSKVGAARRKQDSITTETGPVKRRKTDGAEVLAPPTSSESWEDHVDKIETVEQRPSDRGDLVVHLRWKAGQLTEHASQEIHKRCPLKLLEYYERHLLFVQEGEGLK
ncbi:hypothetical protein BGZ54_009131 [Gamsiella multidivaricata]|nr:hypothetical protein BGZ54_009131 [Gamsiella multidivaricata]